MRTSLVGGFILTALAIGISWAIWNFPYDPSPEEIFNQYFEPYIVQTTPRGLVEESDLYMIGTIRYRDKEYHKAIEQFKLVLIETPNDYRSQIMLGVSHMALREFEQSEPILESLAKDQSHLFQDQARWYLGLLYLVDDVADNDSLSKDLFEEINDKALLLKVEELID